MPQAFISALRFMGLDGTSIVNGDPVLTADAVPCKANRDAVRTIDTAMTNAINLVM